MKGSNFLLLKGDKFYHKAPTGRPARFRHYEVVYYDAARKNVRSRLV